MKSPFARKMLWTGLGLVGGYIILVVLAHGVWAFGQCTGGPLIMNPTPGSEPPVSCTQISDGLGETAKGFMNSVFGAVMFSPIWIGILAVLVILPEISERNRLKRQKD